MVRYAMKASLVVSTAVALLAAQPVRAAMGCWDQRQVAAAKVRDLQSRLLVGALRCQVKGLSVLTAYNEFVRQNRDTLEGANGLIRAQFDNGYGADGEYYYDYFATDLANRYGGDPTNAAVCNDIAAAAQEGAAAAGDVGKLIQLANRYGATPSLPGGECPISFASPVQHAMAVTAETRPAPASDGKPAATSDYKTKDPAPMPSNPGN